MSYIKKLGFSMIYTLCAILIFTFVVTFFNYFGIISDNIISIFKILIPVIGYIIGGFYIGKKANKSGYVEGLKFGIITSIIIIIFNILGFNNSFELTNIMFYLILTISSILGSMVGINSKKKS